MALNLKVRFPHLPPVEILAKGIMSMIVICDLALLIRVWKMCKIFFFKIHVFAVHFELGEPLKVAIHQISTRNIKISLPSYFDAYIHVQGGEIFCQPTFHSGARLSVCERVCQQDSPGMLVCRLWNNEYGHRDADDNKDSFLLFT
jgi:hypothetical protein